MKRPGLWLFGLIASVGIHIAGGAVLWVALIPDPIEDQPTPESQLRVESQQVERRDAAEAMPDADHAAQADDTGSRLSEGTIARSDAVVAQPQSAPADQAAPDAERLAAADGPTDVLATAAPSAEAIRSRPAPTAGKLAALRPQSTDIRPAQATSQPAQTAAPRAETVAARPAPVAVTQPANVPSITAVAANPAVAAKLADLVDAAPAQAVALPATATIAPVADATVVKAAAITPPDATRAQPLTANTVVAPTPPRATPIRPATNDTRPVLAALPAPDDAAPLEPQAAETREAAPNIAALPDSPPDVTATETTLPDSTPATEAPPTGDKIRARLAFPGQVGDVDPVSLAAFQSFVEPEASPQGTEVRDGLSALLARVPCSRLNVSFNPDTATLQVNGHVPINEARGPVLAALRAQMGNSIDVSDNMLILPEPQCNVLSGIAATGLPQSTDQFTNPLVVGEDTHALVKDFVKDERLWFEATGPDYDAFVYVDFFDAAGNVLHVAPNSQSALIEVAAKETFRIGTKDDSDGPFALLIGPPYGQEIAVAFAASRPLYDGLRDVVEPAEPYLEWLTERIAQARAADPEFKGEWVYFFIRTSER